MNSADKNNEYSLLRQQFPVFIYEKYDIDIDDAGLKARFHFNLSGKFRFCPEIFIPQKEFLTFEINRSDLGILVFHIGMIELISYWKSACSPEVVIEAGPLDHAQIKWWKKLYFKGLGEFFYTNGISARIDDFMKITANHKLSSTKIEFGQFDGFLVPIGGGKDSVVSLETLIQNKRKVRPFILNPRNASIDTAKNAGFKEEDIITVYRTIDPTLIELNKQGFLNGHTPFSALLAFVSLLAARLSCMNNIALSNESSSNEVTVIGTQVNHQYSKSFEFENDFRNYVSKYISNDFNYFSFLRPLSELQIANIFSKFPDHFYSFKSCNVGSKSDSWCCNCPKCLFSWIILSPFMSQENLIEIFGENLFANNGLLEIFEELIGIGDTKPFECVGTIEEVNIALIMAIKKIRKPLPFLLGHYKNLKQYKFYENSSDSFDFQQINDQHFVNSELLDQIRKP